ncbi:MAG: tetratricopeptide repeat protein [Candidatus Poribacteria bacterium]
MNSLRKISVLLTLVLCVFTRVCQSVESSNQNDSLTEKRKAALNHYRLGRRNADLGQLYDLAIEEYKKAIQLDPTIAEVYCELGAAYRGKNMLDEAVKVYKHALTLESTDDTRGIANLCLGLIYMGQGKFEEAEKFASEAVKLIPNMAAAHYRLADIYVKRGKLKQAIAEYKRAIELDADLAEPYEGLGLIYTNQGKAEEAIKYYQEAIKRNRYNPDSYYNMARCYLRLKRMRKGKKLMDIFKRMKRYQEGVQRYKKASQKQPNDVTLRLKLAQLHYEHGNLDEVIREYEYVIYIAPDFAVAYNNIGLAYLEQGNFEKAKKAFEKTIELNPKAATAYFGLGQLYALQEKFNLSKSQYQKAIQLAPEYEPAYAGLVEIYLQQHDPDSAIKIYAQFAKTQSESPQTWLRLGILQIKGKRYDDAINSFERAIELDSNCAEAYNNLAWLYVDRDESLEEALELAKKAVELKPEASHLDTLAYAYYKNGQYQEAENEILRALELEPENKAYLKRLEEIRRTIEAQQDSAK